MQNGGRTRREGNGTNKYHRADSPRQKERKQKGQKKTK